MVELLLKYDTKFKDFEIKPLERLFKKNQKELEKGGGSKTLQDLLAGQLQCIDLLKKYKQAPIWEKNLIKAVEAGEEKKVKKFLEEGKDFFYKLNSIIQTARRDIEDKMEKDKKFTKGASLYENVKKSFDLLQDELRAYLKVKRESFALRTEMQRQEQPNTRQLDIYSKTGASEVESPEAPQDDPNDGAPLNSSRD